jgi:hypothetical protein
MKRVLIGMSGGVDSSVAAYLLQKEGYEVVGLTMSLFKSNKEEGCTSSKVVEDAAKVCQKLGIEHHVVDYQDKFKCHIINYFINSYLNAETPNPCVECNKYLKFGLMWEEAKKLNCDYIATGHYAAIIDNKLCRIDSPKDQTYFLYQIDKDLLIKLAVRTEVKKYSTGQTILPPGGKCEYLYIIRRGTVKVTKMVKFIKNEQKIRTKLKATGKKYAFSNFDEMNTRMEYQNELALEALAQGPTEDEVDNGSYIEREITLETLKIGDIFPSYYCMNSLYLDVTFEANNPCDIIVMKLTDVQEIANDTYDFMKKYAKPYPNEDFLRKFYYYNEAWMKYRNTLKYNILADALNRDVLKKNKMRSKLFVRKDLEKVKLPEIFAVKRMHFK